MKIRKRLMTVVPILFFLAALSISPAGAQLPTCGELGTDPSFGLVGNPQLSAVSSTLVSATFTDAAYCQVDITVSSESGVEAGYLPGQSEQIRVRVGLPLSMADGGDGGVQGAWNGKQRDLGGGGYAGSVGGVTAATNAGYVGTSTDTGHDRTVTPGGSFALNPDHTLNWGLIEDFAVDGIHAQRVWGHDIAMIYYGMAPTRHYWTGCSTGGRQGHQQAQTFPKDYDGILAGAPAFNWDRFIPSELWPQIVMLEELGGPIDSAKLTAVTNAAIDACDDLDGIVDGILQEPRRCDYDATEFVCGLVGDPDCLTPEEAAVVNKIWNGPVNAKGEKLWFGLERGAALAPFGLAGENPFTIAVDHFQYWIKQDPAFDWHTVTEASFVDDFATSQALFHDAIGTDQANLHAFRSGGGKMIMYHGLFDQLIFPRGSYDYYNRAAEKMRAALAKKGVKPSAAAGMAALQEFYRFFPYPNIGHCRFGSGPDINGDDLFEALVNWVENGVAPDYIVATQYVNPFNPAQGVLRTRKICKYPDVLRYDGTGSTDDHANFYCETQLEDDPALLDADVLGKPQNRCLASSCTSRDDRECQGAHSEFL